ncbi:MAG: hypothetical protein SPL35_00020 [Bacteroidales bacterium]|nr:hypothetical protein [Bacteroidales bacterium]
MTASLPDLCKKCAAISSRLFIFPMRYSHQLPTFAPGGNVFLGGFGGNGKGGNGGTYSGDKKQNMHA